MKKITLLSIVAFLLTSVTNAQITKGSTFIGGSLNFSSDRKNPSRTTDVETTVSNWLIRPQLGKVIEDNKVVGIFLNIGGSLNKQAGPPANLSQTKNSFYGGGVFFRNYFPIAKRFYLFGDASLSITSMKTQSLADNGSTQYIYYNNKGTQSILSVAPGISFAASKKIHLEAAFTDLLFLSYTVSKTEEYSSPGVLFRETKGKNIGASANANALSNPFIGIRFILP